MAVPTLLELAEAGAHFGHHRSMVYPKAQSYIFTVRNNVALIDLEQTQAAIVNAQNIISKNLEAGKIVLFVGTKRSIRQSLKEVAESVSSPYIVERWFGGTLTNFATMQESVKRMNELEEFLKSDEAAKLSKKDRLVKQNRFNHYQRFLAGLTTMKALPDLIVLASASEDGIAVVEANQLGIPVLAITDTNINPAKITFPIPANDDAPKAVELILRSIVQLPIAKKAKTEVADILEEKSEVEIKSEEKPKKVTKPKTEQKAKKVVAKKTVIKKAPAKTKKNDNHR